MFNLWIHNGLIAWLIVRVIIEGNTCRMFIIVHYYVYYVEVIVFTFVKGDIHGRRIRTFLFGW